LTLPGGPGVRWDGGIATGVEVGLSYDPMLAKLIVHAPTRIQAVERMKRALLELRIDGVDTSVPFHLRVMDEPDFRAGDLNIRYLDEHEALLAEPASDESVRIAALAAALLEDERRKMRTVARPAATASAGGDGGSAWRKMGWRR
jgi:acetyl-CoA carboxylase biotin carboxylase subunit